ncbi:GGDEF domain-containing protein [Piscibacillus salipiscarius]|uniref:GGDEF domain-containing protein n=1 Tax=Piscibacillus salipiscarius TaxID=299480 RepID=UPI0006D13AD3|nr:GGDEF domain-containing protein [Piscibacillus salipiscarius]
MVFNFSVLAYTMIGFYQASNITTDVIWTYLFNVSFFIIIGLFAGILALRERKHLKEKVSFHDQSIKDYVTGLYNHRSFQNTLSKLTQSEKPITLIMADIDNFKQINDRYGHTIGDQVLSAFGNTLIHELDPMESYSFRYGGEEFAIILFDRHKRSIEQQINEWNKLFQHGIQLIPELKGENITISYGVAFSAEDDEKDALLKRADDYMYLAKSNGKNQVMFQESYERIGES